MLRDVIELQDKAVKELVKQTSIKDIITFKAPTGSGKTHMMADYMSRVLIDDPSIIFIVSSLSKSNLAEQNVEKFQEYIERGEFTNLRPLLISTKRVGETGLRIDEGYNVYVLPRDLAKKDGLLMRGPLEKFLTNITSANVRNKKIYLIKDECHIATNNLDSFIDRYFSKTINVSATPDQEKQQYPDVEIRNEDAVNAKLIKTIVKGDDGDTFEDALVQFKKLKAVYHKELGINPCMIVQISNKDKGADELENTILKTLKRSEFSDLQYVVMLNDKNQCISNNKYFSESVSAKDWNNLVKHNNSEIDVIIFKMVISEGFDIPRACMLYQERLSRSEKLNEQVVGRVRRNPCLVNFEKLSEKAKSIAMIAYVWGNMPAKINVSVQSKQEAHSSLKIMTTCLKKTEEDGLFDFNKFVSSAAQPSTAKDIFELYDDFTKMDFEAQLICERKTATYQDWVRNAYLSKAIQKSYKSHICNYEESMELTHDDAMNIKLITFPVLSSFEENEYSLKIKNKNWVWSRNTDIGNHSFSFDSDAEKDFADELKDFVIAKEDYLWGKNFLPHSEIKFEYYWNGIHASFPDFILKDGDGQIHIFEVKSKNVSSKLHFDEDEYEEKIEMLKECYKQAAILTGYIFYIPIKSGSSWEIVKITNGGIEPSPLTLEELFASFK